MPAPDRSAELVVAFLNTLDVEAGTDQLGDLGGYRAWVHARADLSGVPVGDAEAAAARALRTALRLSAQGLAATPATCQPLILTLDASGEPRLDGDGPLAQVAAAVAITAIRGTWARIKICPADDCRWAFYDASRNRSRSWCSMAVCGNRAKARNHRARAGS
jgi:predicted RNA-binding Zn ribbon-like protein